MLKVCVSSSLVSGDKDGIIAKSIINLISNLFSVPNSASFLSALDGQTVYIEPVSAVPFAGGATSYGWEQPIAAGGYYEATVGAGITPIITYESSKNADYGETIALNPSDISGVVVAGTGGPISETLSRALFHELAHFVDTVDFSGASHSPTSLPEFSNAFVGGDNAYPVLEALAVGAENYIYIEGFGGQSRVGHNGGNTAYVGPSFNPDLPFRNVSDVAYAEFQNDGVWAGVFSGVDSDNNLIKKDYYQAGTQFTLTGPGSVSVTDGNYVTVSATGGRIVEADGTLSQSFLDAAAGMAVGASGQNSNRTQAIQKDLHNAANNIAQFSNIATAADAAGLNIFDTYSSLFNLADIYGVIGLSNERFTEDPANYVGPERKFGPAGSRFNNVAGFPETALFLNSAVSSVLIGASGFSSWRAEEKGLSAGTAQPFSRSYDVIEGGGSGHNAIIAGNENPAAGYSSLIGVGDGDIIFGGTGNDHIWATAGAELVFASAGNDVVHGNNGTIFAVPDSMGKIEIDVAGSGTSQTATIMAGGKPVGTTTLNNVHIFMGSSELTTFNDNPPTKDNPSTDNSPGSGSVFIAGSGGGIFYLQDGDTAIGNPNAKNVYFLPSMGTNGKIPDVNILNFGPNDKIMIQNQSGQYVPFTGYQAKETFITIGGHYDKANGSMTGQRIILSRTGSNSLGWPISYPANYDTGASQPGFTDFGYKQVYGTSPPQGPISDISYTKISNSAGVISFISKTTASGASNGGLNLNIQSSTANLGSTANLHIQETYTYNGLEVYDFGQPYFWDRSQNFNNKVLDPSASDWPYTSTDLSVFQNQSIQNISQIIATANTPSISMSAGGNTGGGAGVASNSASASSSTSGTSASATLTGTTTGATLDSGGAYTTIVGEGRGDTILFNQGYGAVTIDEADHSAAPANTLQLGAGFTAADTFVTADSNDDVILDFNGSDSVTLANALLSGNGTTYGVQAIQFADGTVWHYSDLLSQLETASSAIPTLYGDSSANVLDGKGVTSNLVGNGGGDTFLFNRSYGALTIAEADAGANPNNVLILGTGLLAENVVVSGDPQGDININFGNGDVITLQNALDSASGITFGVQQIQFADGTVWTYADLLAQVDTVNPASQTLFGDGTSQAFDPKGVDNTIVGGGGGDTIVYHQGYGALVIEEADRGASLNNVLQLGAGLIAANTAVTADASGDILLSFGKGDVITLANALNSGNGTTFGVQAIAFADGTVWHYADLLTALETPSATNTTLYGDMGANVLDGHGVARTLVGNGGGDTFVYSRGYGALTIDEADAAAAPHNALQIGAGLSASSLGVTGDSSGDIILSFGGSDRITLTGGFASGNGTTYGVQSLVFADGTTLSYTNLLALAQTPSATQATLYGDRGGNTLDGKGIATTLVGGGGGDKFVFNQGYGSLTIDEADTGISLGNELQVGSGIGASTTTVTADAVGDLVLNFGGADQVTLTHALNSNGTTTYGAQQVNFADGTSLTYAQLLALADTPSATNAVLYGDTGANALDGQGIAHTLVGNGGGDTFAFNQGFGALTIIEHDPETSDSNVLRLGAGLTAANAVVTADAGGDLILNFGAGDVVTIQSALNAVASSSNGIQQVKFADGATWTFAQMLTLADIGSAQNTVLYGDDQGDVFDPKGYAHTIHSAGSDDSFLYNQGYGALTINEVDTSTNPDNGVRFGAGISASSFHVTADAAGDLVVALGGSDQITIVGALNSGGSTTYGIQQFSFADGTTLSFADLLAMADVPSAGNTTLYGDGNAQTFDSGGIAHTIIGNGGGDTIVYGPGYGALLVNEVDQTSVPDNILQLGAGITPGGVTVSTTASGDVILSLTGSDQITLAGQCQSLSGAARGVQQIVFADGTTWGAADIASYASGVITVAPGSGKTVVDEAQSPGGAMLPVIDFATASSAVTVTMRSDLNSLILTAANGASVEIDDIYNSALGDRQLVQFAGGVIWHLSDILAHIDNLPSVANAGQVTGTAANETFDFATIPPDSIGDKTVSGGGGSDMFRYGIGDGRAEINQMGTTFTDLSTLAFGTGITLETLSFSWDYSGDLVITANDGQSDSITISGVSLGNSVIEQGIQRFTFSDGSSYSAAQILAIADTGTAQNNGYLYGDGNANVIDPAGFVHTIIGGGGGDTILYDRGYGDLYIDEVDKSNNPRNTLVLVSGIDPSRVTIQAGIDSGYMGPTGGSNRLDSLVLTIAGSGTITLAGALSDAAAGVQTVEFADGTVWTVQQMVAMLGTAYPYNYPYSGQAVLVGGVGADTLDPSGTAHYVDGNGGGDTIIYNRGYGALQIDEIDQSQTTNTLAFGAGISASDVTVTMSGIGRFKLSLGNGDVITFEGSGGGLASGYFQNTFEQYKNAYTGIEAVTFADGSLWTIAQLVEKQIPASSGTLYGTEGAGIFDPKGVAHTIDSQGASDQVVYNLGYGALTIDENSSATNPTNTIAFGAGISASMLNVTTDGTNLYVSLNESDTITINNALNNASGSQPTYGIQNFTFADGTTLTYADMLALADTPSTGNTSLYGDANGQAFDPKGIANTIYGGGGADTILYNQGYGALAVYDAGQGAKLKLGAGLTPTGLALSHNDADIILSFANGDAITLRGEAQGSGVDTVSFANGTVWNRATLLANVIAASPGGPVIDSTGTTSLTVTADDTAYSSPTVPGSTISITDADANNNGDYAAAVTKVTASGNTSGLDLSAFQAQGSGDGLTFTPNYQTNDPGAFDWSFGYTNTNGASPFGYLLPGQSVTLNFQVAISDPLGRSAVETVSVTVNGVAASPSISYADAYGNVFEQPSVSTPPSTINTAGGSIAFTDPYSAPTDTVTVQGVTASGSIVGLPSTASLLSMLSLGYVTEQNGGNPSNVNWTFSVPNSAFAYLPGGENVTLNYAVQITNDRGGSVTENITVGVYGAWGNGVTTSPVIAVGTAATGAITEQAGVTGSATADTATGVINFTDGSATTADNVSVQSVSVSGVVGGLPSTSALLAMLSRSGVTQPANGNAGSVRWYFSAPDSSFDYLGTGETATLNYVFKITNASGGSVTQNVNVTVTGTNDLPVIATSVTNATGSVNEQANAINPASLDSASGVIAFTDADLSDTHTVSITGVSATGVTTNLPSTAMLASLLTQSSITEQAGATPGSVGWSFSVPDGNFAYLSQGETVTLTYGVQVVDSQGGTAIQNVVVTVAGTNDLPIIVPASTVATSAIVELAGATGSSALDTAGGSIGFTDTNLDDTHTASVTGVTATGVTAGLPATAALLGFLSTSALSEAAGATPGSVGWSFSAADANFDYLAAGQTVTLNYAVQVLDNHGGAAIQTVAVTVTGTNDAPVIAASTATGAITERAGTTGSAALDTVAGTIGFTDADRSDTHVVTVNGVAASGDTSGLPGSSSLLSWLSLGSVNEQAGATPGSAGWNFSAADSSLDYLGAGETVTLTYSVQVSDNHGGTVTQNVVVTITGTNDAPVTTVMSTETARLSTATAIYGISIADPDDNATETVTLTSLHGNMSAAVVSGATVSGAGTKVLTVSGALAAVNATIANLTYTSATSGSDTISVVTSDGTASNTQTIAVTVNATVDHAPVVVPAATVAKGTVTEIANITGSVTKDTAAGAIAFNDADLTDKHTLVTSSVTVSGVTAGLPASATLLTYLKAGTITEQVGTAAGSAAWVFSAPDKSFDYLASGETATLSYVVTLADNHRGATTQTVTVTITGTNDVPVIATGTTATGAITERASLTGSTLADTASGTIKFTDVDINDTHTAIVTGVSATGVTSGLGAVSGATLKSFLSLGSLTNPAGATAGSAAWNFSAADSTFDYLAAGEKLILTYTVQIADNHGGTVNQNVAVTITGTNDAPVIVAASTNAAGSITELANTTGSVSLDVVSGSIGFADADLSDKHTLKVSSVTASGVTGGLPTSATLLTYLTAGAVTEAAGSAPGAAAWTFSAPDKSFDYLAAGQTATLSYVVTLADNHGGSTTQTVLVTITGTNDAPVIATGTTATGAITERANLTGSTLADTASGTIKFTDVDLSDTHTASITGVTATGITSGLGSVSSATLQSFLSLGTLTNSAGATAGSVGWSFSASDNAFDYLAAGEKLVLTYAVQVSDNHGGSVTQNIVVTVTGTNDLPLAIEHSGFITDNQTPLTISAASLLAGASDADISDVLSLKSVQGAVGGTVALVGGNAVFTPTPTAIGPASFTYTATDNHGGTSTATVNLTTTLHDVVVAAGVTASGNTMPGIIDGRAGNDILHAGSAGDTLMGGPGDTLYGGAGIDTFAFHSGFGQDAIYSFTATGTKHDILQVDSTMFADWAHLMGATKQVGTDLLITLDPTDTITLKSVTLASFTSADAHFV